MYLVRSAQETLAALDPVPLGPADVPAREDEEPVLHVQYASRRSFWPSIPLDESSNAPGWLEDVLVTYTYTKFSIKPVSAARFSNF